LVLKFRCLHRNTSTENLAFLDVDQGIEDLVFIIRNLKVNIPGANDSKVILVGGSYAGTLASWLKQRHPDLVTAVWASSAPVHAKLDFKGKTDRLLRVGR
jgi:pimeloyl-ACP methyl ester carboxylesterase